MQVGAWVCALAVFSLAHCACEPFPDTSLFSEGTRGTRSFGTPLR